MRQCTDTVCNHINSENCNFVNKSSIMLKSAVFLSLLILDSRSNLVVNLFVILLWKSVTEYFHVYCLGMQLKFSRVLWSDLVT